MYVDVYVKFDQLKYYFNKSNGFIKLKLLLSKPFNCCAVSLLIHCQTAGKL